MKNTFGSILRMHTFGESHGPAMGVVIDGLPAGLFFRGDVLIRDLERRRPGSWDLRASQLTSSRKEPDTPEVLSGVYQGRSLGTPICVVIRNQDMKSQDYENLTPRSGHADDLWPEKFGHADLRGGGRASGRETVARVVTGAFCKMLLQEVSPKTQIKAYALTLGPYSLSEQERAEAPSLDIDSYVGRFPSPSNNSNMVTALKEAQSQGDSWGGVAEICIKSPPAYLGQPVFHKLKNDLASALMSVGAVNGVSFGATLSGSMTGQTFHTAVENYGGIRGGLSTGEDILIQVTFKPTSSISDVAKMGRHDPCIVPRAIPVLEAMVAHVLADHFLWSKLDRIENLVTHD